MIILRQREFTLKRSIKRNLTTKPGGLFSKEGGLLDKNTWRIRGAGEAMSPREQRDTASKLTLQAKKLKENKGVVAKITNLVNPKATERVSKEAEKLRSDYIHGRTSYLK